MARVVVGQDGSVALAGAAPLLDQVAAPVGEEGLVVGLLVVLGAEVVTQLVTEAVVAQCTGLKVNMYGYLSNIYSIYVREPVKKKMWKIPYLGGGSGPGHFPHFKKKWCLKCILSHFKPF